MILPGHRRALEADPAAPLPLRFAALAAARPEAPLVAYGEWRLNYGDVNGAANRLAHRLIALGVSASVPVALGLPRDPDLLVALLAVLKAGGVYVPLDPQWPAERLRLMAAAACPAVLITRTSLRDRLPSACGVVVDLDRDQSAIAHEPDADPDVAIDPQQWCYLLFTSGSTGTPKGVPITHGNLAGLFPPLAEALDFGPRDVWTWFHSASFGFSAWELLGAMLHGGSLVIVPESVRQDPVALGELLVEEQVTVFSQTPSAFRRLLHEPRFHACVDDSPLRYLALSGEAIRGDDIGTWLHHGHRAQLINTYALTETAGQVALRIYGPGDADEAGARNLGRPLAGRHVLVLDAAGEPVPAQTAGELWVGGDNVTPGYLDAPERADRFITLPVPGHGLVRGYRTGDRLRQLPDGSLEYLGRVDAQLKFRGYRIEPGDIESALRSHPGVRDAAVGVWADATGNQRLTAWVVRRVEEPAPEPAAASTPDSVPEFWPSLGAYGVYDSWLYGLMNTEPVRLAAYRAAFAATVPGKVVLDIGTGQDALLARLCIEAGAAHVYAVEVLEEPARRAADLVAGLGLADRITVLHGDIADLELPVRVEACTQGIIGNIGSADGIVATWNSARRHFADGCVPVPARCTTRIAALELPAAVRDRPAFGPLAADYVQRLFAATGAAFDLRLCLRNVAPSALLSTAADFEVLDFAGELATDSSGAATLAIMRDGWFDGCLLWTVVDTGAGDPVDYFREQQAWLPVYLPLADMPLRVRRGDELQLHWESFLGSDDRFPDYRVTVRVGDIEVSHVSCHRGTTTGSSRLHRQLLASLDAEAPLSVTELRHWLQGRVPEHLVPQGWMFLPQLPLGPGDKLDRAALPAPGNQRPMLAAPPMAPRTVAEQAVAMLWTEVLGFESLGVDDDFFELGGDSIAAVQLTTRLQRWLDAGLPLAVLFDAPTIAGLTQHIERVFAGPLAAALARDATARPAAASRSIQQTPLLPEPAEPPEPAVDHAGTLPLTFSQQSLWFLDALHPGDSSANEQFAISLRGPLDHEAFRRAFAALLERHPVLLATVVDAGGLDAGGGGGRLQPYVGESPVPALPVVKIKSDTHLLELAEAGLREAFDLRRGPLVRAVLCVSSADQALLLVTAHHIVADGMSVRILRDDLAQLYALETGARSLPLPAPGRHADLAGQRRWQEGRVDADALAWWQEALASLPPPPLRALVRPATGERISRRIGLSLDADITDRLRALAHEAGATPYMVALAAFRVLLARLTGEADLCIGTPMTLRDSPELAGIVGCLVNPVVLRNVVPANRSFREQLQAERRTALDAFRHRDVPFSRVVEAVAPSRELDLHPLFQVLFSWEPAIGPVSVAGIAHEVVTLPAARRSYFDLECTVQDGGEGAPLAGYIAWSAAAIDDHVGRQLPALFRKLLADALAQPDIPVMRLALLPADVRQQVLHGFNQTNMTLPAWPTLHDGFLERARREPAACALRGAGSSGDEEWSCEVLAARSAALAGELLDLGQGPRIGVAIGRSPELVLAVLAVLRAGGIVVPLDPGFPAARLQFIARDADLALVITRGGRLPIEGLRSLDLDTWQPAAATGRAIALPAVVAEAPAFLLYTSGSTGEPKGAWTTHRAAVSRCHWMWTRFGFAADDIFALRTTPNFIDAWWEMFGALIHGAVLQVVSDDIATDAARLPAFIAARGVSQLVLVPSLLDAVLDQVEADGTPLPRLRFCISSGEPLPPAVVRRCRQRLPDTVLINTYGTSEIWDATAFDTRELAAEAGRVPIGRPVGNARVYVLDRNGQPVPPGIPGEICVAGIGVQGGYWRRPALEAERYVGATLPELAGERLYRTGDRGRLREDGTLECLGRLDAQFKLRGQRIEPAEIEQALKTCPAVDEAIVGIAGEGERTCLVAGLVLRADAGDGDATLIDSLRRHLQERLPAWMVPAEWRILPAIPRTPSGKLDRAGWLGAAHAKPLHRDADAARDGDALEQRMHALWCAVMGRPDIGLDDNFFDLGGHSLLAIRLLNRVRAGFEVSLGLRDLFTHPTVAGLCAWLRTGHDRDGGQDHAGTVPAVAMPAVVAPPDDARPDGVQAGSKSSGDTQAVPLSFAQERLWFLDQLDPGSPAWNVAWTIRCSGPLDLSALEAALDRLLERHPVLRTRIQAIDGRPVAFIAPVMAVDLVVEDIDTGSLAGRLVELARRPFDNEHGPLFKAHLLRVDPQEHHLLLLASHIVTDATSNHLLFDDLAATLAAVVASANGTGGPLPAMPPRAAAVTYAEFVRRQRMAAVAGAWQASLDWWRERLAGAPPALELPTDQPRPAEQHYAGATLRRELYGETLARLRDFAGQRHCTVYMVLLAAFKAVLHRYSGATDLLIGTPVEGRLDADVEAVVGLFINTLVMRTDLSGDPAFDVLLARVRDTVLEAQARQALPFEKLVEALAPERSLARSPVFQVLFNLIQLPDRRREIHDPRGTLTLRMDRLVDTGISSFDLCLTAVVEADRLSLHFEYATELFHAVTIGHLADACVELLLAALVDPSQPLSALPLLPAATREAVLALGQGAPLSAGAGPLNAGPFSPVHEQVAAIAGRMPEAPAVTWPGTSPITAERPACTLTYGELETRARQLAHHLGEKWLARGDTGGAGVRIGICLPRTPECIVAVLAVLKTGAAHVPLDPDWPAGRLATLATAAGLAGVITDATTRASFAPAMPCVDLDRDGLQISQCSPDPVHCRVGPADPAYLIHTSGSTGTPKAVAVTHANIAAAMAGWQSAWDLQVGEAHLQMAGLAFDVFAGDWLRALGSGGHLVLCPRETLLDPPALLEVLGRHAIRVAEFVPAIIRPLVAHCRATGEWLPALRLLIVGSDAWHGSDLEALRLVAAPGTRLINSYGVAEATIDSCWFDATTADVRGVVPIGRPFPGVTLEVVDRHDQLVPPGVPGELLIGGSGVAAGYWQADARLAARFGADGRYRTGDIARWNPAGQLELKGRRDCQVKLRGFRIEPAEIEACLARYPGVQAVAVVLKPATGKPPGTRGADAEAELVAFIATGVDDRGTGSALDVDALRLAAIRELPAQMVPARFIVWPRLPLNSSGKIDRLALTAHLAGDPGHDRGHDRGRDHGHDPAASMVPRPTGGAAHPLEEAVCEAMADLLDRPAIGVDQDFFRAGGHSLLAARLIARLRSTLAVELPLRAIFEAPTPRGLAAAIRRQREARPDAVPPSRPTRRPHRDDGIAPLSAMQQRLWFLERLNPGTATWHLHWLMRVTGPLDRAALQAAVDAVVARHEVLRTSFIERDGMPLQRVEARGRVMIEGVDAPTATARDAAIQARSAAPFDLSAAPLMRVLLVRDSVEVAGDAAGDAAVDAAGNDHHLLLVIHHLVADGWSFGILGRDLATAYRMTRQAGEDGLPPPAISLPALPLQYADHAQWQQFPDCQARLQQQIHWWRSTLAGAPALLELPSAAPRTGVLDHHGAWLERRIPAGEARALRSLATANGATLFMVLIAAFKAVLGRLAGTDDVVVGTPVAGRTHRELEDLVGFFVNTLALRTSLAGAPTFGEVLARVRQSTLSAFDHAEVPFEKLVEALQPRRTLAHSPLVQVLFVLHNQPFQPLVLEGLVVTPETVPGEQVKFDLNLHVAAEGDGLRLALGWRTALYPEAAAAQLLDAFAALIKQVAVAGDESLAILLDRVLADHPLPLPLSGPVPDPLPMVEPVVLPAHGTDPAVINGLRELWSQLLPGTQPADDDDYFLLGGHSLLAMRLVAAIAARFNVELPLVAVFEAPALQAMAARIASAIASRRGSADVGRTADGDGVATIPRRPRVPDNGSLE